jgi:hypothetical protein
VIGPTDCLRLRKKWNKEEEEEEEELLGFLCNL